MLDPDRLHEWVSIHRRVNSKDDGEPREGYEMNQTLCLRGANFKVKWTLTEGERPKRATWEGRGPAHSYARTSYRLSPNGTTAPTSSTRTSSPRPAGSSARRPRRVLVGGVPQREANRSLAALKALIER